MCAWYIRPISSTRKRMHMTFLDRKVTCTFMAQLIEMVQSYESSSEKTAREPTRKLNSKNRSYEVTRVVGKTS